jgi:hypothetical protein
MRCINVQMNAAVNLQRLYSRSHRARSTDQKTAVLAFVFRGFPQYLHANAASVDVH